MLLNEDGYAIELEDVRLESSWEATDRYHVNLRSPRRGMPFEVAMQLLDCKPAEGAHVSRGSGALLTLDSEDEGDDDEIAFLPSDIAEFFEGSDDDQEDGASEADEGADVSESELL